MEESNVYVPRSERAGLEKMKVGPAHFMLDLETTGIKPGCRILAIGIVHLATGNSIQLFPSLAEQEELGLRDLPATLEWWQRQPKEVYAKTWLPESSRADCQTVCASIRKFFKENSPKAPKIWGNGADFDLPILDKFFQACAAGELIPFWNGRCFRTMKNCFPVEMPELDKSKKHTALEDAEYQAVHLTRIVQKFNIELG